MKDRVLFKSKEYGYNGHNYCELRILEDGDIRLWVHDGGTNSLICMDRDELVNLGELLIKHGPTAPEEHKTVDIFKRNKKDTPQKKRKVRSDKGTRRSPKRKAKKSTITPTLDMDKIKADNVSKALEE